MVKSNPHFQNLTSNYLFVEIDKQVQKQSQKTPSAQFLNLGIGDITQPIAPSVSQAIAQAALEMSHPMSMRGYGPANGYSFLRQAIKDHEYAHLPIDSEEIFVSAGAKEDTANILDIFCSSNHIALAEPSYPVYVDTSLIKSDPQKIIYLPCKELNGFKPEPPQQHADLVYLCSPANPTGTALTFDECKKWVQYALDTKAILLFDAAYSAFITSTDVPHSIYEIPDADKVAIEFKSFSKTAGFTGLRCSYTIVPKKLQTEDGSLIWDLWKRRQMTKFGGLAYPIQKGALATYTEPGKTEIAHILQKYKKNIVTLREGLQKLGYTVFGGIDAPYIWMQTPVKSSWDFFHYLLENKHIITIPGSGFGPSGEGYIRLSGFATQSTIEEMLQRLQDRTI